MQNIISIDYLKAVSEFISLTLQNLSIKTKKKGNGKVETEISLFNSTAICKREVCSDLNKFVSELITRIKEEILLNDGTVKKVEACAVSRCDYAKAELDVAQDKIIFTKEIKDAAETVKLIVNTKAALKYLRYVYIFERAFIHTCEKNGYIIEEQKPECLKSN